MAQNSSNTIVTLSSSKFMLGAFIAAAILFIVGRIQPLPPWVLAAEVCITVFSLFIFGSIKYRLHKNALTYGAAVIMIATFWEPWWQTSTLRQSVEANGWTEVPPFILHHFFTLEGLDHLVHADTMLFILGLTFFVSVIAQTRLLESISFNILKKFKGWVVPTVIVIAFVVSFFSGILDGVSMIGLMIRTLIIILFLAKIKGEAVLYAVMISTISTTVCGMWLAYGEPPNLIMKSNLHPHLDDAFFLRYCMPIAVGSFIIVAFNMYRKLKGKKVDNKKLDILDLHTADVRFLQASRHGKVLIPLEFIHECGDELGDKMTGVENRLQKGEPLGAALIREQVPEKVRRNLLAKFVTEPLSQELDENYMEVVKENEKGIDDSAVKVQKALDKISVQRIRSQMIGVFSFFPFIALLIWHAIDHDIPLFWSSFAGFGVAFIGIYAIPKMRRLCLKDAKHEYSEYLFLFPLFFSITLLQKTGFFDQFAVILQNGIDRFGAAHVAYLQFIGTTFLSAILDNNVVADFAGRALENFSLVILHLFAMAQIAGYAVGGCWTHIGSAQAVVAYAFIRKEVDSDYTPFQWIKAMTPILVEIFIFVTIWIYIEGIFFHPVN